MAARKSSRVNPKYKTCYRVQNWPEYERGLRSRGDVTIWFGDEAVAAWTPPPTGLRGGQRQYSNLAILTSLTLHLLFRLPLRQTEGFVGSMLRLMGLDLKAPGHSTLSRRGEGVEVPRLCREHEGPIQLVVDSTGLKISNAGDWSCRKHRKGKARRGWRKLHIGIDDEGFVVAAQLTGSKRDDASAIPDLLEQIEEIGRRAWLKESGYRQQARAENAFFRWKRILGDRLRSRHFETQIREAMIGCGVLNRMFDLGKPRSQPIAA